MPIKKLPEDNVIVAMPEEPLLVELTQILFTEPAERQWVYKHYQDAKEKEIIEAAIEIASFPNVMIRAILKNALIDQPEYQKNEALYEQAIRHGFNSILNPQCFRSKYLILTL